MSIELGGVRFPRVHRIVTLEQAAFVYHRIPGQDGNLVQNLGRDSVRLQIEGIFYGPKAQESLATLRDLYIKRAEVDFVADITDGAYAGKVTLDRLNVSQSADAPEQFSYSLVITEFVPPPKQTVNTPPEGEDGLAGPGGPEAGGADAGGAGAPAGADGSGPGAGMAATPEQKLVDDQVKLDAKTNLETATLPDDLALGSAPEITNPTAPLKDSLNPVQSATSDLMESTSGLQEVLGVPAQEDGASNPFAKSVALAEKAQEKAKEMLDSALVPDMTNPFTPVKEVLEPVVEATSFLVEMLKGLYGFFGDEETALSEVEESALSEVEQTVI